MLSDLRTRVDDARRALDQLDTVLASPAAASLPGLPVAQTFTAVDSAANKLAKLAGVLTVAAANAPAPAPKVHRGKAE